MSKGHSSSAPKSPLLAKRANIRDFTMIIALIVIAIVFQILTNGIFLNARNISTLFRQTSIIAIIACSTMMLIVSGNFDLSVGSIVLLTGGIPAILQVWFGWGTIPSILCGLLAGCVLGAWNGFWVAYKHVPSFIVTLGGMMMFKGIYLVVSKGVTISPVEDSFAIISQGFVPSWLGWLLAGVACVAVVAFTLKNQADKKRYGFTVDSSTKLVLKLIASCGIILVATLEMNSYRGIPYPVMILLVVVLLVGFLTKKTSFGRKVFAIGGNVEAAKYSGIKVEKVIFSLYILSGLFSAISGSLSTARLNGATATAGNMFEMDAIAACVIGGTSLDGGRGSILGAMVGALIIASLDNGMSLMNISSNFQYIVKGLVLIFAVWFDVKAKKHS